MFRPINHSVKPPATQKSPLVTRNPGSLLTQRRQFSMPHLGDKPQNLVTEDARFSKNKNMVDARLFSSPKTLRLSPDYFAQRELEFHAICHFAENYDLVGLNKLRSTGVFIHMSHGIHSPIGYLAAQGKEKAVNFLSEQYPMKGYAPLDALRQAIRGYASGKHHDLVNALQFKHRSGDTLVPYILEGYAIAGGDEAMKGWLNPFRNDHFATYWMSRSIVVGYVYGNHASKVSQELNLWGVGVKPFAMLASAYVGINVESWKDKTDDQHTLRDIVIQYALGGHDALVDQELKCGGTVTEAACGYIRAERPDKLQEMILLGADVEFLAFEYQLYVMGSGHHKYAIPCALHLLASMSNDYAMMKLGTALQKHVPDHYDINLSAVAYLLKESMDKKQLNFAKALEEYNEGPKVYRPRS